MFLEILGFHIFTTKTSNSNDPSGLGILSLFNPRICVCFLFNVYYGLWFNYCYCWMWYLIDSNYEIKLFIKCWLFAVLMSVCSGCYRGWKLFCLRCHLVMNQFSGIKSLRSVKLLFIISWTIMITIILKCEDYYL